MPCHFLAQMKKNYVDLINNNLYQDHFDSYLERNLIHIVTQMFREFFHLNVNPKCSQSHKKNHKQRSSKVFRQNQQNQWNFLLHYVFCTGKSMSKALAFASTNPKYDNRLFIGLRVQYMKTTSSEHVYINCSECQNKNKNNLCTHVLSL